MSVLWVLLLLGSFALSTGVLLVEKGKCNERRKKERTGTRMKLTDGKALLIPFGNMIKFVARTRGLAH